MKIKKSKKPKPKPPPRTWRIVRCIATGSYTDKPNTLISFIQLRVASPNGVECTIRPDIGCVGVDPASNNFEKQMRAYEQKAQLAMIAMQGGMAPGLPVEKAKPEEYTEVEGKCAECDQPSAPDDYLCASHRQAVT